MESPAHNPLAAPLHAALPRRQFLWIVGLFWTYVALSNVLYAHSFSVTLANTPADALFAPWRTRVLQHLLLLGPLLLCFAASLRIGWQPLWRALPLQALLAVGFSALPHWAMSLSVWVGKQFSGQPMRGMEPLDKLNPPDLALWIASGTNFLLQYGFGLALVTGFALYRRFRDAELQVEALAKQSTAARLSALRLQLSPHTLFNLLNTIRGQIGFDPGTAQQLVVQLSDLLRRLLNAGEREFSTLRDEVQFARLYLSLQQSRFADRLRLSLPDERSLPAVWVPSLILQPLIENAVVHGLAAHDGPVRIDLDWQLEGERLVLRVINDRASPPGPPPAASPGIGLQNVRERLDAHFGTGARLDAGPLANPSGAARWQACILLPAIHSR